MPDVGKGKLVCIEEEEGSHLPIDKGWAWVVCAACFGIFVLLLGTFKTHGMLLVEIREKYPEASPTMILWVVNGASLCGRLSGPIHGYILSKITHRTGLLIGLFMMGTSTSILGYLPRVEYMYPLYTLMFGFGSGLTTLACYSATYPYFKMKKGLALAITSSGGGGGVLIAPFILRFLFDSFNFASAMLLFGGFTLQGIILAMLVRPLSFYQKQRFKKHQAGKLSDMSHNINQACQSATSEQINCADLKHQNLCQDERPSILFNSTNELAASVTLFSIVEEDRKPTCTEPPEVKNGWKIVTNSTCMTIGCVGFFFECGLAVTFICLPPLGKDNNVSKDFIALLLTAGGVLEIPCRIFNGYLADRRLITACTQLSICLLCASLGALLCGLISGLAGIIIMVVTLAVFSGPVFSLIPLTLAEFLGKDNLTKSLGIVYLFQGLGIIVATFSAGGIYESTNRWENVFIYSFGCLLVASVICSLYSYYNYRKQEPKDASNTDKREDSEDERLSNPL